MLVLIIIIAVMSSVIVPSYSRFYARTKFDSAVQSATSLLSWARDMAIQTNATVTVSFDTRSQTFVAQVEPPDPSQDQPTAFQDTGADTQAQAAMQPRTATLAESAAVASFQVMPGALAPPDQAAAGPQASDLHFYPDGSADHALFTLVNPDGYSAEIEVVPTTGRTVVHDDREDLQNGGA